MSVCVIVSVCVCARVCVCLCLCMSVCECVCVPRVGAVDSPFPSSQHSHVEKFAAIAFGKELSSQVPASSSTKGRAVSQAGVADGTEGKGAALCERCLWRQSRGLSGPEVVISGPVKRTH